MSRRAQENIAAVVLLIVFGGVIWLCQDFGPRARMIPLPLAILGLALTLLQLLWQNVRSTDELQMDLISVEKPPLRRDTEQAERAPAAPAKRKAGGRREAAAFGIVMGLIALIFVIGLIPAVFVFTAAYLVLTHYYSWLAGLAYAAVFTACVYGLFMMLLEIQPYYGLLAPLVDKMQ